MGKVEQILKSIQNGSGFATYDSVLNSKHSPLDQKSRILLLIKLAKLGILVDGDKINGVPKEKSDVPPKSFMNLNKLEKKYKDRTNPNVNEGIKIAQDWNKVKNIPKNDLIVSIGGSDYILGYSADGLGDNPYGIVFPGDDHYRFLGKDRKANSFWKKHRNLVNNWRKHNVNEMKKPNFKEFEPVTGKYDFNKLSSISDMGNKVRLSKKEFDEILKKLKTWGVDVFRDDHDDFFTIFSYGDNYNLVKVKVNESREKSLEPGVILQHKHNPNISIELVDTTKRGWKVKETTKKGKRSKTRTAYYYDQDVKGDRAIYEAKFGYTDGTASYMKNHKNEYKTAIQMNKKAGKKEIPFYDELEKLEAKIGHPKYMVFLSNALRGFNVDMYKDPKIHNPSEAEEALYKLSK